MAKPQPITFPGFPGASQSQKPRMTRCAYGGHVFDERTSTSGSALFCTADHHKLYTEKFGKDSVVIREDVQ